MAGLLNRILWSPVENFIRTQFSLPKFSLDPFGDFEKHFLKNRLISVPVNKLENKPFFRIQYKSILIIVFQLIVMLKFLFITLNKDQEFLVKIGAGMMPFNPLIGRLMYFSFFTAFFFTTAVRIIILIAERFNKLTFLTDFEGLKKDSGHGTAELGIAQSKIPSIKRSLAFWLMISHIIFRFGMTMLTLLFSGLYSIGIFRSGNLLVSINYVGEYILFMITLYYVATEIHVVGYASFVFQYINMRCGNFHENVIFIRMYIRWLENHRSMNPLIKARRMTFLSDRFQEMVRDHLDIVSRIRKYDKVFRFMLGTVEYGIPPLVSTLFFTSFMDGIDSFMSSLIVMTSACVILVISPFIVSSSKVHKMVRSSYTDLSSIQFCCKNIQLNPTGKRVLFNLIEGMVSGNRSIGFTSFGLYTYRPTTLMWMFLSTGMFYMTLTGFVKKLWSIVVISAVTLNSIQFTICLKRESVVSCRPKPSSGWFIELRFAEFVYNLTRITLIE